jgi:hypothetical protein
MVVQCRINWPLTDPYADRDLGKHFLNDPSSLVIDSLSGLCAVNPHLSLDVHNKGDRLPNLKIPANNESWVALVVYLASPERSQVALVCGGGSGHEPSHAGFVGWYHSSYSFLLWPTHNLLTKGMVF